MTVIRKALRWSVWSFMLLLMEINAQAVTLSNLNTIRVSIKDTSASSRQAAFSQALGAVLVKMSGNSGITTLPMIHSLQLNAGHFVQSYTYLSQDALDDTGSLALQISFDKKELKRILQQSRQPVWSEDRPLTLLWLEIKEGTSHQVLSNSSDSSLVGAVQASADARGLPILFPVMDLQDWSLTALGVDQNGTYSVVNPKSLEEMLTRYRAPALLAGDIELIDKKYWQGQWVLWLEGVPYRWRSEAVGVNEVLSQGINNATNLMANQYAVVENRYLKKQVLVEVSGVNDLNYYAQVLVKLRHLAPVVKVSLEDIKGSTVLLSVEVVGGLQALVKALSNQSYFLPVLTASDHCNSDSSLCADLHYRWNVLPDKEGSL